MNTHWHLGASFLHEANLGVDPDDPDLINVPKALLYHQRLIDQGRVPVLGLCDARG